MRRLYVLDGHGYIFRAHFGLMNAGRGDRREVRLSTSDGLPTGAIYVFTRMLLRLAQDVAPSHMAVVFDAGRGGFRQQLYPAYKAHRPPTPDDLALQLPYFPRLVEALGWPTLRVEGVEADDVIATLVTQARARATEAVIYSADKDLMQLVGPGVTVIDSLGQKTYAAEDVIAKFGVRPDQVGDYLALVGDASDNIPGLDGVGAKTAAKLLADYDSIDALIAANPPVPRAKVKHPFGDDGQRERLAMSRALVALKLDVPLPRPIDDLATRPPDRAALHALFTELQFAALAEQFADRPTSGAVMVSSTDHREVDANTEPDAEPDRTIEGEADDGAGVDANGAASAVPHGPSVEVELVTRAEPLAAWVQAVRAAGRCGLAIEFAPDGAPGTDTIVGLALAIDDRAAYVPIGHHYIGAPAPWLAEDLAPVWALLADPAVVKHTHDGKRLARRCAAAGRTVAGLGDDTLLIAFLLDPTANAHRLDHALARLAGATLAPRETVVGRRGDARTAPVETVAPWLGQAASAIVRGAAHGRTLLAQAQLEPLYDDLERPLADVMLRMEQAGILLDVAQLHALETRVAASLRTLETDIFALAGEAFNLGSPKQLAHLLFDRLGLRSERMRKTKTGYSTDHDVLEAMLDLHPIIAKVIDHRELGKLTATYLEALPPLRDAKTGRIHTTFNQAAAATGRISSQDPNLQNIPIRSPIGQEIRRAFIAAPGHRLITADYSQIEMRILAHVSEDPVLLAAFRAGADIHTQTAAEVFGIAPDAVGARERRIAKAVNYGLIYGQSDFGLARALDIPRHEAAAYSARYFERFPTIRKALDGCVADARAHGGTRTLFGRWRPIPDLASKSHVARRAAERVAQNTPMQGAGADILKRAMLAVDHALTTRRLPARLLLTVHDELVLEAQASAADEVAALTQAAMSAAATLLVPLEVDVGIAENWADA